MKSAVFVAAAALISGAVAGTLNPRAPLKGNCVRRGHDDQPYGTCLILDTDHKTKHIPCDSGSACPDDGKTHRCSWSVGKAKCHGVK